jgi:hypothetical protein
MEGAVFSNFENQIIPWKYKSNYGYEITIDFGRRRPAVLFTQEFKQDHDVIFDAILPDRPDGILIDDLLEMIRLKGYGMPLTIYCDPAGGSGNTHTYDTDISKTRSFFKNMVPVRYTRKPALTRIEAGIMNIDNRLQRGLLFIADNLRRKKDREYTSVINALHEISYPEDKDGKPMSNKYEKEGKNEHPIDCLRYFVINKYPGIRPIVKIA